MYRRLSQNLLQSRLLSNKNNLIKYHNNIILNKPKRNNILNNTLSTSTGTNINKNNNINKSKPINRKHIYLQKNIKINKKKILSQNISNITKITGDSLNINSKEIINKTKNERNAINIKGFKHMNSLKDKKEKTRSENILKCINSNKTLDKLGRKRQYTPYAKKIENKKINEVVKKKLKDSKDNLSPYQIKVKKNNNLNNYINTKKYLSVKQAVKTKKYINEISQRLFSKETVSSKNKMRKAIIYTPKKKLNSINNIHNLLKRSKTCIIKRRSKLLLTSQNTESRFYTSKTLSPPKFKVRQQRFQRRSSIKQNIDFALHNLHKITSCKNYFDNNLSIKQEENYDNKENSNMINNTYNILNINNNNSKLDYISINQSQYSTVETSKSKGGLISKLINSCKQYKNDTTIHNYLYHNINSPLSLEIIISESKGLIYTKCPSNHIKKYKFYDFYNKFRAIPELNSSLNCFICKRSNNLNNYFCGSCFNFLCSNCLIQHEKDFGHQIISIQNINSYCSLHNEKYIMFCFECNKNCCEFCHTMQTKKHKLKTFKDILNDFKKEEKSISFFKNEINYQLKALDDFMNRYKEDLESMEDIYKTYFEEYVSYFRNLLLFKEKLISRYNYNPNNYYNIMNVLNLSLPIIYNYKKEKLYKLSSSNDLYEIYLKINNTISFINNNSIKIFEGHENINKNKYNYMNNKTLRTIKPSKILDINNVGNSTYITNDKYPKQILDLKYNGHFLLVKDKSIDIYDKDLNLIKSFNLTRKFGDTYTEIIIGAKLLDNKSVAIYNYKKILVVQFTYDFLFYEDINEYDIRMNIKGFYKGFNNFGFEDTYEESNYNSFINNIIDINENEILSFGTRLGERHIASIWNRNKYYDRQTVEINSNLNYLIHPIYSVLKYNQNKFAILEKNENTYSIKIYKYMSPHNYKKLETKKLNIGEKNNKNETKDIINNNNLKNIYNDNHENKNNKEEIFENDTNLDEESISNISLNDKENGYDKNISKNNDDLNNTQRNFYNKGNRYENDDNISENEDEYLDKIINEIHFNAKKREEEYLKSSNKQKNINNIVNTPKKVKEDIIISKEKVFNEVFDLKNIKFKISDSSPEELLQQLQLIKLNEKLFGFIDFKNIVIIDFETCQIISNINYGDLKLIFIDKTPSNNFLFKENSKIISYHLKDNNLIKISLPVFEYIKNDKNISSWFLISGTNEFINKAKIIDDKFMISLFELKMEKWNLNPNNKEN